jgi:hypothetical protein
MSVCSGLIWQFSETGQGLHESALKGIQRSGDGFTVQYRKFSFIYWTEMKFLGWWSGLSKECLLASMSP